MPAYRLALLPPPWPFPHLHFLGQDIMKIARKSTDADILSQRVFFSFSPCGYSSGRKSGARSLPGSSCVMIEAGGHEAGGSAYPVPRAQGRKPLHFAWLRLWLLAAHRLRGQAPARATVPRDSRILNLRQIALCFSSQYADPHRPHSQSVVPACAEEHMTIENDEDQDFKDAEPNTELLSIASSPQMNSFRPKLEPSPSPPPQIPPVAASHKQGDAVLINFLSNGKRPDIARAIAVHSDHSDAASGAEDDPSISSSPSTSSASCKSPPFNLAAVAATAASSSPSEPGAINLINLAAGALAFTTGNGPDPLRKSTTDSTPVESVS
ncbi:predicted protein [Verticillium alfalfae VaMs.102]|uniref:Predicted protein n=1 Tax=Verticillium alfalfae (strain VaMs.102 / ATCC MYA-4576 / FGSC 10136) TaxID=526221 RepID=C9SR53_VERA1|nr:predicted protein [Verticillium alfalfae VaMs.102]EEY20855.1 predicted protein [Verticillium alfalfae VaMs.102]